MFPVFVHSDMALADLGAMLPHARVFIPAICVPNNPPYLVRVEANEDYSVLQSSLMNLAAQGAAITTLPHPRDKTPFTDAQLAKLQKHTPQLKKGHGMSDLLGLINAANPSASFDPALHCF